MPIRDLCFHASSLPGLFAYFQHAIPTSFFFFFYFLVCIRFWFGLVTPDPFSSRELSWAQDYILATLDLHATVTEHVQ